MPEEIHRLTAKGLITMGKLPFDLEIKDISALADLINDKDLGEILLEDKTNGAKLVIKGKCPPPPMPMGAPAFAAPMGTPAPAPEAAPEKKEKKIDGTVVKAPIVGTYYSSPSPDKPAFVTVGKKVKKGDVIMIIESMKIMNEIPSPCDGEVKEIMAQNGQAVEYDEPVMIIG